MHPILLAIQNDLAKFGYTLPPPCTAAQIQDLCDRSASILGALPPDGYLNFLRQCDGLEYNGLEIYSATEPPEEFPSPYGFVGINARHFRGDWEGMERTLVFARDSCGFFALDLDSGIYRVESFGGIVTREFQTFEELLDEALSTVSHDLLPPK